MSLQQSPADDSRAPTVDDFDGVPETHVLTGLKTGLSGVYHTRVCDGLLQDGATIRTRPRMWVEDGDFRRCKFCSGERDHVDDDECERIRQSLQETQNSYQTADDVGRAESTVRDHVTGHCSCDPDVPPLEWTGDGWEEQ